MKPVCPSCPRHKDGFTLIELLVVIAIIAILSVVGIVTFTSVQKGARDARRRADIDALAKAYETQMSAGKYVGLVDSNFSSGKKPQDPNTAKGHYFNWLSQDGSGFKVCASLDNNPNNVCNTPAANCYCKFSTQSLLNPSSPANTSGSTQYTFGLGGSSQSSCDTNGTLLSGLVGYWKMDESVWNGTSGEVRDSSGYGNHGRSYSGASITTPSHSMPFPPNIPPSFQNAGNFDGSDDYVSIANSIYFGTTLSISAWFKTSSTSGAIFGTASPDENYVGLRVNSSKLNGMTDSTSLWQSYDVSGATNVNDGAWHHAVFVINNTRLYMYLDGGLDGSDTILDITAFSRASFASYTGMSWSAQYFNGQIDDVRVYNKALSPIEIQALYNNGSGCIP